MKEIIEIVKSFSALSTIIYYDNDYDENHPEPDARIYEFISYQCLFDFFKVYDEWQDIWTNKPLESEISSLEKWTFEIVEKTDLGEQAFEQVKATKLACGDLQREKQRDVYLHLRRIYIPEIIFRFHNMLFETRHIKDGTFGKIDRLIHTVADDTYRFYDELSCTQALSRFVALIRNDAGEALEQIGDLFV